MWADVVGNVADNGRIILGSSDIWSDTNCNLSVKIIYVNGWALTKTDKTPHIFSESSTCFTYR